MTLLVGCFLAAITAMAFGYEYLSYAFFVAGMIIGVYQDRRDQIKQTDRAADQRLRRELERQR